MPEYIPATGSLESVDAELARLRAENAELRAQVAALQAQSAQLLVRVQELEARLAKDSHNSSKPPSSDPPFKKPPPRSLRGKSARKPGGQKGHPGATRTLVDDPEHTVVIPLNGKCACGQALESVAVQELPERRQVIELTVRRAVTEYRTVGGVCACGQVHRSRFPESVAAPVQCGPGLSAFAVYLTAYQLLPYRRASELIQGLAGIALSPATLLALGREVAERVSAPVAAIGQAIAGRALAHADETGLRVGGALQWLHVLCTASLTFYAVQAKRGRAALAAIGLLASFRGTLVHDHWAAYRVYSCVHAFCNAHHLRELIAVAETDPKLAWPTRLIALLCEANEAATMARGAALAALPGPLIADYFQRFDALLAEGAHHHPPRPAPPGSRKRVKQSPAHNLIVRLQTHREAVLRFITDLCVPFDNNQAERDIRMPKLKQKVCGCFRSATGAQDFAVVRSYLSTLHKQSVNTYHALVATFRGNPPMPRLA